MEDLFFFEQNEVIFSSDHLPTDAAPHIPPLGTLPESLPRDSGRFHAALPPTTRPESRVHGGNAFADMCGGAAQREVLRMAIGKPTRPRLRPGMMQVIQEEHEVPLI